MVVTLIRIISNISRCADTAKGVKKMVVIYCKIIQNQDTVVVENAYKIYSAPALNTVDW